MFQDNDGDILELKVKNIEFYLEKFIETGNYQYLDVAQYEISEIREPGEDT